MSARPRLRRSQIVEPLLLLRTQDLANLLPRLLQDRAESRAVLVHDRADRAVLVLIEIELVGDPVQRVKRSRRLSVR